MIDAERMFPSSAPAQVESKPAPATAEEARAARMFPSSAQPVAPVTAPTLATDDAAKPVAGDAKPTPGKPVAPAAPTLASGGETNRPGEIFIPPEIANLRAEDPEAQAERLYGETPHDAIVKAVAADVGTPEHLRTAEVAVEWSKIARDIGIDDAETQYVVNRIAQLREAPIDRDTALKTAMDALARQFDDPVKAFNDAAALARRDSRVARLLDRTGLGNDADTIVMLAKRAYNQRIRGRLT